MAINPLTFTNPQAYSGGADFSQLGKLGEVYRQSQADQRRQTALSMLGGDPSADAATLIRSGDAGLVQLGINMRNRLTDQAREDARYAVTDPREERRLKLSEAADLRATNADVRAGYQDLREGERLKILQEKAARENRTLSDVLKERHEAWINQGFKPEGPAYQEWMTNEKTSSDAAANKASVSPIYGTRLNAQGQPEKVLMQLNPRGEAVETKLPSGVLIAPDQKTLDLGDKYAIVDKQTNEVLRYVPKNLSAAAEAKQVGEDVAKAKNILPSVELNTKYLIKNIDDTVSHPGKEAALGWKSYFPTVRGSEAYNFENRLNQTNMRAFLQAYDQLRGAGQISEREGQAASAALSRAKTAQSVKEFDEAMGEFRSYVIDAANAARKKAGVNTGQGSGADATMASARSAIQSGADPKAVRQRLIDAGIDPGDIGK